jgi:hypothetical protein
MTKINMDKIGIRERLTIKLFCMIIRVLNYSWFSLEHNRELETLLKELEKID